jgi:hypothetical protein
VTGGSPAARLFGGLITVVALAAAGCATGATVVHSDRKITEPRVIALDAPRLPWVVEIETRLRQRGFQVLRFASQRRVRERINETRTEEYREATARYVVLVDGSAPLDPMRRCIGGGYKFDYLSVELVDVKANETVLTVSGGGYSENCAPVSGTIFGDIVTAIENAWK